MQNGTVIQVWYELPFLPKGHYYVIRLDDLYSVMNFNQQRVRQYPHKFLDGALVSGFITDCGLKVMDLSTSGEVGEV